MTTSVVCDGCWVQGDRRHHCQGYVKRPGVHMSCQCKVDLTCGSWQSGDELRSRWETA